MSKIEKSAREAMGQIQDCRTAAVRIKGEAERLAYACCPAGARREALLTVSNRAAATVETMNAAEKELADVVQAIRKEEAVAVGADAKAPAGKGDAPPAPEPAPKAKS